MTTPEVPKNQIPEVQVIPEAPQIPESLEKGAPQAQTTPQAFPQVADDKGLIQTPENQEVVVKIPKNQETLKDLAKGSTDDASTWWGAYFIRAILKAIHFGKRVIFGS